MALIGEMQFLERLQFFNGQRLFASDLQSLEADNRERRWLHNASLHQPGVGSGYAVSGNKGEREVTITPGYAIDALGREVILTEARVEPVPPVADDGAGRPIFYDLTVSYPDDQSLEETETREGLCQMEGVVRLREQPVFCWVRLKADKQPFDVRLKAELESGLKIRLARAEVFDCQLNNAVSTAERRNARPSRSPYVTCGSVTPDSATWKILAPPDGPAVLIEVDTAAAAFVTTPCYSAHIVGDRFFSREKNRGFDDLFQALDMNSFLLEGFLSISSTTETDPVTGIQVLVKPSAKGFDVQLSMPQIQVADNFFMNPRDLFGLTEFQTSYVNLLKDNGWHLVWLGVEN